jgi:hypothetical protein
MSVDNLLLHDQQFKYINLGAFCSRRAATFVL